jgi:integrase
LTPTLREELVLWRSESRFTGQTDHVLSTSTGRKHNPSNLRRDVLRPAVTAANEKLAKDGLAPIGKLGFHRLRRTWASMRCVCGDDPRYTATQGGWEDARFVLRVYAQAAKRRERLSGPHLKAYDRAIEWAQMGTSDVVAPETVPVEATKTPPSGVFLKADDGTRTHDLLHGKQTL